jgi:hypothetical protein
MKITNISTFIENNKTGKRKNELRPELAQLGLPQTGNAAQACMEEWQADPAWPAQAQPGIFAKWPSVFPQTTPQYKNTIHISLHLCSKHPKEVSIWSRSPSSPFPNQSRGRPLSARFPVMEG